jgi:hypothetical protein
MSKEVLPEDTENKIYIEEMLLFSIEDLINICNEKWDNVKLSELKIEHEHIQVKCFGYDQYDSSDYKNYFVVTKQS